MEFSEIKRICEALLFTSNRPLRTDEIKEVLDGEEIGLIKDAIAELKDEFAQQQRSFEIREIAGGYVVTTRAEYGKWLKKLYKDRYTWRLSGPSLETLAIIAYRQPITKAEIELIRGVNVDGVISSLLERDLIKISGRKEVLGRPLLYSTTKDFLTYFGLNSVNELPALEDIVIPQEDLNEVNQAPDALISAEAEPIEQGVSHEQTIT